MQTYSDLKRLFLLLMGLIVIFTNSEGQKMEVIKRFDIAHFNANKSEGDMHNYIAKDGTDIRQFYSAREDRYFIQKKALNSPYRYNFVYNHAGKILFYSIQFYEFYIKDIKYNLEGKIIREDSPKLPHKLSFESLAKIMKERYQVNIMDTREIVRLHAHYDEKNEQVPYYIVSYLFELGGNKVNEVLIDGDTGEILFERPSFFNQRNIDIVEAYKQSPKKRK